jgi:large subunit ribosomal protein L21
MTERKDIFDNYAIFQTGGKQYQAIPGKTISIEKIEGEFGKPLEFADVLLRRSQDGTIAVGTPFLPTTIKASIIKQMKDPKVIVFKFKRRKKSRVKHGHRQPKTIIRIESI